MLTFKEWRDLNESVTGTSFTLGVARPATVGGIVGSTGASDWLAKWKLLEAKKMKKKMFGKDVPEDEEELDPKLDDADLELGDEEGLDDEEKVSLDDEEGLGDEELGDEEGLGDEELDLGDEEGMSDEEGMGDEEDMDMPPPPKKGKGKKPPFAKGEIMKKGMKKDDGKCKGCNKMMSKCSCKTMKKGAKKQMTKEETDWWNSVMGMIGPDPNQKNWDGISVREDALFPEIDPNALALAQVPQGETQPKPGEPGFSPATRIGQL